MAKACGFACMSGKVYCDEIVLVCGLRFYCVDGILCSCMELLGGFFVLLGFWCFVWTGGVWWGRCLGLAFLKVVVLTFGLLVLELIG